MQVLQKIKSHWPLCVILAIGAFLRLFNINHGLGVHPDERGMIMVAEKISLADLNPHSFNYGSFVYYLLWIGSQFLGIFSDSFRHYDGLFTTGRLICAAFGLAAVAILYFLTLEIYKDKVIATLAAFLLAFNVFHLQLSRFYTSDVILTTLTLAALWGMLEIARGRGFWAYLVSGLFFGLSMATKISALYLLAPLGISFLVTCFRKRRFFSWPDLFGVFVLLMVTILTFCLVEPYAILDYANFVKDNAAQTDMVRGGWRPPYIIQYEDTLPYFYALKQMLLYTMGWPVAIAALLGVLAAGFRQFRKPSGEELVILALIIPTFLLYAGFKVKFPRYLLPLYPAIFVLAADFLGRIAIYRGSGASLVGGDSGFLWKSAGPQMPGKLQELGAKLKAQFSPQLALEFGAVIFQLAALGVGTLGVSLFTDAEPFKLGAWLLIFLAGALALFGLCLNTNKSGTSLCLKQFSFLPPQKNSNLIFLFNPGWQFFLFAAGLFFLLLALFTYLNPHIKIAANTYWLYAVILCCLALFAWPARPKESEAQSRGAELIVVSCLVLAGFFLRFAQVDQIPWFVHGDEGEQARIAWNIWSGGVSFFDLGFFHMPNLAFALQAPFLGIFGLGTFGMRAGSAILGTLTLPAFYFMAKQFYGRRAALIGLSLLTVFHAHIWFSRVGLSNVQVPLLVCLSVYFLILAVDFRSIRLACMSGIWLGIGYQSYVASQMVLLVIAFLLILLILFSAKQRYFALKIFFGLSVGVVIGLGPFLLRIIATPEQVYERAEIVSLFRPNRLKAEEQALHVDSAFGVVALHSLYNLLTPVCKGNQSDVWYGLGKRMFGNTFGALYLLSFFSFVGFGLHKFRSREMGLEEYFRLTLPLAVIVAVSIAVGLTYDAPAWQRLVPFLPFIILLPSFLLAKLTSSWKSAPLGGYLGVVLAAMLLLREYEFGSASFFGDLTLTPLAQPSVQTYLVHAIDEVPKDAKVYLFAALPDHRPTYPTFYSYGSIWLERPYSDGTDIQVFGDQIQAALNSKLDPKADAAFVFYSSDESRILPYLQKLFPVGVRRDYLIRGGPSTIVTYLVGKQELSKYQSVTAQTP